MITINGQLMEEMNELWLHLVQAFFFVHATEPGQGPQKQKKKQVQLLLSKK